MLHCTFS